MGLARIGLGSNLGDAAETVRTAIGELGALGRVAAASALYRTPAWGVRDQPDFINAAVLLETPLGPHQLLGALQALEAALGRRPTYRWGPRVIDLDILAYDDLHLDEPALTIPHARLRERAFALVPLAEIDPAFEPLRDALGPTALAGVVRVAVRA